MIHEIIIKEIRAYFLSTKFVVTFLLSSLLLLVSIYVGIGKYIEKVEEYDSAQSIEREQIESHNNPTVLLNHGFKVFKRPEVLSIFVGGIQDAVGRYAEILENNNPGLRDSTHNSKPLRSLIGNFDLIFLTKFLLSLTAILFTYNAISGEKERGTLRAIVSNQIPRYKIIIGKIMGGFLSLIIPLTIPLILGFIFLTFNPNTILTSEEWVRSIMIIASILVYVSVFYLLGIFISSLTKSSFDSLFILALIWIFFVFIIPQISLIIAEKVVPTQSIFELNGFKREIVKENLEKRQKLLHSWMEENKPVQSDDLRNYFKELRQNTIDEINKGFIEIDHNYQMGLRKQQTVARLITGFSPVSTLQYSTMSFARTGIADQDHFQNYVNEYVHHVRSWANEKSNPVITKSAPRTEMADFSDMPVFNYTPENLGESVLRALPDIATMIVMILFLLVGSVYAINIYDVR